MTLTTLTPPTPLELASISILILIAAAALSPLLFRSQAILVYFTFSSAAIASIIAAFAGFTGVYRGGSGAFILPMGLPDLPIYLRLDPLSGFFVAVIGLISFFISIYSIGYMKGFIGHRPVTTLAVFYSLFIAGMLLVVLADDAYSFMIAWELMAASSYFLVFFEDEHAGNRRAAFIYLLIAHIGAVLILLSFGIMAGFASGFENMSGYTFSAMRSSHIPPAWASAAFLLAFFGFAAKAGAVPLHVWVPEADPAAPSNVVALMSGVMIKTAIYGMIRVSFDLLNVSNDWWGGLVLAMGLISAVMGILYAIMQNDLKRLLAYSSVENIGIILSCLGLAMIFKSSGMAVLAALALTAGLYHVINHAVFKSLLFMGAGAVIHSTRQRNMEGLGGLIHKMRWTAPLFLVGCVAISGLPPFNGFVSEWLTFQSFLLSPVLGNPLLNLLIPLGAALLALTVALSARCFVKVYGITFLGHWRGRAGANVHEVNLYMRLAMILAAASCLLLGVFPSYVVGWMDIIPETFVGARIGASGWMWLTPVAAERASYSAPIVFLGIFAIVGGVYLLFSSKKRVTRRAPLWDCGFAKTTERMQYSSTSFSMPMRRIFGSLFSIKETVRGAGSNDAAFNGKFIYHLKIRDRVWYSMYKPFSDASFWIARKTGKLQHGKIQIYLLYSFITLIILLILS